MWTPQSDREGSDSMDRGKTDHGAIGGLPDPKYTPIKYLLVVQKWETFTPCLLAMRQRCLSFEPFTSDSAKSLKIHGCRSKKNVHVNIKQSPLTKLTPNPPTSQELVPKKPLNPLESQVVVLSRDSPVTL